MELHKPKLSIVIPIYNSMNKLQRCINSLLMQSERSIEIIAIDDCSTDDSLRILKEISDRDERIRMFRMHENKGPHLTRKLGISYARGQYIAFVDSDDWCSLEMYEKLLHIGEQQNSGIVMCNAMKHKENDNIVISCPCVEGNYSFEQIKDDFYLPLYGKDSRCEYAYGYLWCFIFHRDLFKDIVFHENVTLYEDEILLLQLLKNAERISFSHDVLYHYDCTENGSLSRKSGYWPEFWDLIQLSALAKQDIAKKHGLPNNEYMPRLGTFLYKGYLRAISNETCKDNSKTIDEIKEFCLTIGKAPLLDQYIDHIEKERFSPRQYKAIVDRKTNGPIRLYEDYCAMYDNMSKIKEYLKNEVFPYGI